MEKFRGHIRLNHKTQVSLKHGLCIIHSNSIMVEPHHGHYTACLDCSKKVQLQWPYEGSHCTAYLKTDKDNAEQFQISGIHSLCFNFFVDKGWSL